MSFKNAKPHEQRAGSVAALDPIDINEYKRDTLEASRRSEYNTKHRGVVWLLVLGTKSYDVTRNSLPVFGEIYTKNRVWTHRGVGWFDTQLNIYIYIKYTFRSDGRGVEILSTICCDEWKVIIFTLWNQLQSIRKWVRRVARSMTDGNSPIEITRFPDDDDDVIMKHFHLLNIQWYVVSNTKRGLTRCVRVCLYIRRQFCVARLDSGFGMRRLDYMALMVLPVAGWCLHSYIPNSVYIIRQRIISSWFRI